MTHAADEAEVVRPEQVETGDHLYYEGIGLEPLWMEVLVVDLTYAAEHHEPVIIFRGTTAVWPLTGQIVKRLHQPVVRRRRDTVRTPA